jgi:hypothetical protein
MSPDRHLRQIELCLLRCLIVIEREQTRGLEIATYERAPQFGTSFLESEKRTGRRTSASPTPTKGGVAPT